MGQPFRQKPHRHKPFRTQPGPIEAPTQQAVPAAAAIPSSSMSKDQFMQMLINAPQAQAKQILGERLYALVQPEQGPLAGKITVMLLEGLDNSELVALIDDHNALGNKIREALAALEAHAQAGQRCFDRGQVHKEQLLGS
jgi:polyadenylate-binding protein